jgi:hypothetical protein
MMIPTLRYLTVVLTLCFLLGAGKGGAMSETDYKYKSISDVPASAWEELARKKIYFGHQSVGYNIMDGIGDVLKENPQIKLKLVETRDKARIAGGIFAHSRVGQNRDPESKINDFVIFNKQGIGNHADIAFFKLCMVDFDNQTDADELFRTYTEAMSELEEAFQETTYIHMTAPVTTDPPGFKKWIFKLRLLVKRFQGQAVPDISPRTRFNQKLRDEYKGKAPFFDLAQIEATFPDGRLSTITENGQKHLALIPEYTDDGGHLNRTGRKYVAEKLLLMLVSQD